MSENGVAYKMAFLSSQMIKAVRERFFELLEREGLQMTELMVQEQIQMNNEFTCGTEGRKLPNE